MTRYLLDTSAINRLHDEPSCKETIKNLLAVDEVWISVLNVAEVARITEPLRRTSLIRLLKTLTDDRNPLEEPIPLIQRAIRAYSMREPEVLISLGSEADIAWSILNSPEHLAEKTRNLLYRIQRTTDAAFLALHQKAREDLQALIASGAPRPPNASALLRRFASDEDLAYAVVGPIYRGIVGRELKKTETFELLRTVPYLSGYLLAWGQSAYQRAIAEQGYGKKNPGVTDLDFAAYLPLVDCFITADKRQYRALRIVAHIVAPRCRVLLYKSFYRILR